MRPIPAALVTAILAASGIVPVSAAESDGETVLARMIAFHDPTDDWMKSAFALRLRTEYADGRASERRCEIDYATGRYRDRRTVDGRAVEAALDGDACTLRVEGRESFSAAFAEEAGLTCENARLYRDYLGYLWGLPMKLRDPGAIVDPTVRRATFQGRAVLALDVRYEAEVGTDAWTFYAKPDTAELVGYSFVQESGKGEYIVLDGTVEMSSGAKIPKRRTWYLTEGDRWLGTDELVSIERLP